MVRTGHAGMMTLGVLLLSACNSGTSTALPSSTPPANVTNVIGAGPGSVLGYVASAGGGAAVQGSAITVMDDGGGTVGNGVTDSQGRFVLQVSPGTYTLTFKRAGYASSVVEHYPVLGSGQQLNVIQKMVFNSTMTVGSPKIQLRAVRGQQEVAFPMTPQEALDFNVSDGLPLHVIAQAAGEDVSPKNVYLSLGLENTPGSQFLGERFADAPDPKNTVYDKVVSLGAAAIRGQQGDSYLNVVVYDNNNNRVNTYTPVKLHSNQVVNAPLGAFLDAKAISVTVAQKIGFQSLRPQSAPVERSSVWVDLSFNYQNGLQGNILGYRVFTSDDNTTYRLLKTLSGSATTVRDSSPSLTPEQPVYYYVQAYNSVASVNSPVMKTTPLGAFTLSDLGPANHGRNVSVRPALTWHIDQKIGDYRKFLVLVNDYPSQGDGCYWGDIKCGDVSESGNNFYTDDGKTPALKIDGLQYGVQFNENGKALQPSLQSGHSYTLDLSAAAFRADGSAVSIAQDYYSVFYDLPVCNLGGPVCEGQLSTFTTGDGSY